jgi:hypothetical protein
MARCETRWVFYKLFTIGAEYWTTGEVNEDVDMAMSATKLLAAESDLSQLMADVTRAMEKAQEAVARIASKAAAADRASAVTAAGERLSS